MSYQQIQEALDAAKLAETTEFVNKLLDNAEYFSDVENYGLEQGGFTPEGITDMVENCLFVNNFRLSLIDLEAAARSLNEEFGYGNHAKRVFLRLTSYRVDELNRERQDLSFSTPEWSPGEDVEAFLQNVNRQVRIMLKEQEAQNGDQVDEGRPA